MDYKRKLKLEQGSLSCPNLTISGNGRQPDIIIIDTDGILLRRDRSEKGWFFLFPYIAFLRVSYTKNRILIVSFCNMSVYDKAFLLSYLPTARHEIRYT